MMSVADSHLEPEAIKSCESVDIGDGKKGRVDLLVRSPSETTKGEQFPLVPTHADILYGPVDDLCFACRITQVRSSAGALRAIPSRRTEEALALLE